MTLIKGQTFYKSGKKAPSKIKLDDKGVHIFSDDHYPSETLPWEDVTITNGGAGGKLIFFRSKKSSVLDSTYIEINKDNLAILASIKIEKLAGFLQTLKRSRSKALGLTAVASSAILLSLFIAWIFKGSIIGGVVDRVPYKWEQALGERLVGIVVPAGNLISSGESWEKLSAQVNRISKSLPENMQNVSIYISKSSELNAFALPGGHIVFNEGLLKSAKNIEEVLGVAAHELAHVKERHVLRGLVQSIGLFFAVDLFLGDMTGILAVIGDNSQLLLRSSYSRDQERQADRVGFDLLVQSDISPEGMVSFFRTLEVEEKKRAELTGGVEKALSFISTHPTTEERIEIIENRIKKEEDLLHFKKVKFDYKGFLSKL